jgi:predicted RNase H-like nuclease (RuvC/YqgF family)
LYYICSSTFSWIREEVVADLEQRVTTLEREVSDLKARVGANDEDMQNIPELIRTEFRLTNSQIARLSRDVAELQRGFGDLTGKVEAMPRVLAELVSEMLADRDKKR